MSFSSNVNVLFVCIVVSSALLYYLGLSFFSATLAKVSVSHSRNELSNHNRSYESAIKSTHRTETISEIAVAVVACGDRLDETLTMLKSALIFTEWWQPLRFIIFSDDNLTSSFKEKLTEWKSLVNNSLEFELHPITFPKNGKAEEWRKLFKPCASQRLFLPVRYTCIKCPVLKGILSQTDSVLYVDTDTLFLSPLKHIWNHFKAMNSSQMAALAFEHEDPNTGWYNRFAHHPFYGPYGVNSGVMLMNLTRMRKFHWEDYVIPVYKEFKLKITWDKLYIYPCRFNYRSDHCMYMSVCSSAEKEGVAVLHGSRGTFHSEKQPAFRAVFQAFEEYQLGSDLNQHLLLPLKAYLDETAHTHCGQIRSVFTKAMDNYFPQSIVQV
ncbi:Glucoside xylosyltransferase 1 [Frankliniella fusca]|uniref:Glucoside xylosyltransferase 1 n=1 Tax=Frankliniella fusca TaxID=407009 RepID=A0AAE1HUZ9_9NEOP|nr:Glucoside xylosyltransferase 1 [Frankliniella fusca]